jgi:FkbM family methyltransferase
VCSFVVLHYLPCDTFVLRVAFSVYFIIFTGQRILKAKFSEGIAANQKTKSPYFMSQVEAYKPSWKNSDKYGTYLHYFFEYLKYGDLKSLGASLKYVMTHKLPQQDYTTKSGMGTFLIRKNTTDFQFINYAYEKSIKDYLRAKLDSFDVFIDLGACIGEYSIWLAKEGKQCIAVEPVNYKGLINNIKLNGLESKIKVFSCGVGDKKERVFFNIPDGVTSSSYMDKDSSNEPNGEIDTLDNIIEAAGISRDARILMKLDVEGMEPEAIRGGASFMRSCTNLRVIYEHFPEDDFRNDKCLLAVCEFSFENLDEVNRIATKV